jgi:hypothetical protein
MVMPLTPDQLRPSVAHETDQDRDRRANRTRRPMSRRFPSDLLQDARIQVAARLQHWPGDAEITHRG